MLDEKKRRWFRFSLRTLLVVVALVGIWLAIFLQARRRAVNHAALANNYAVVAAAAKSNIPMNNFKIDNLPSTGNKRLQPQYTALFWHH